MIRHVDYPHLKLSKSRKFTEHFPVSAGICAIHVALETLGCEKVYVAGIEMSMNKAYHPSLILEKKDKSLPSLDIYLLSYSLLRLSKMVK